MRLVALQGAAFQLVQIDLSDKPRWYRTVNSSGLVPAVEHDGTFHTESMDICRWASRRIRQEGPALDRATTLAGPSPRQGQ